MNLPLALFMTIEMPLNSTVSHCWHIHRISRNELLFFNTVSHWKGLRLDHFNSMLIEWQGLISQCNIRNQYVCIQRFSMNFWFLSTLIPKMLNRYHFETTTSLLRRFLNSPTSRYWNINTCKNKLRM